MILSGQKRPKLVSVVWILITGKEISLHIQWGRFTFDEHFVPKLCRQKWNRSSEDYRSKGKLWIIVGPLKPRKAGQGPWKVHVLAKKLTTTNERCSDDQRSIQWLSLMGKHFKLLFNRRKMWQCLLRIVCRLPNTSLTLKSKMSCNCCFEALNLTTSHVYLNIVWQVSPQGISRAPLIG